MAATAFSLSRLAVRKPDLRDLVENTVDLAWVGSVWMLKERLTRYSSATSQRLFTEARAGLHFDLLRTYVCSAAIDTSSWSASTLVNDFVLSASKLTSAIEQSNDPALRQLQYLSSQLSFNLDERNPDDGQNLMDLCDTSLQLFFLFELEVASVTSLSGTFEDWFLGLEPVPPSLESGVERALALALERVSSTRVV